MPAKWALLAAALVAVLASGCATQSGSSRSGHGSSGQPAPARTAAPAVTRSGAVAAPCAAQACAPGAAIELTGGYSVRLWRSAQPAGTDSSTPVVELLAGGRHAGWWVGRLGYGWAAQLSCLATAGHANCAVTSALGAHAGSAELLWLAGGALHSAPAASVTFDSSAPAAADLDGDGLLDVTGMENDYRPDYAYGHNYWATYRGTGTALRRTGCMPASSAVPPRALLTGPCPVVAQG